MIFSLIPRKVYQINSKVSGLIEVTDWLGRKTLTVQGMIQSGGVVDVVWRKPLKKIKKDQVSVRKVLILGLGGGTLVGMIKKYWPKAKMIGVELDPEVVKVGRVYFGLSHEKDLKIIIGDAFQIIKRKKFLDRKYDLIIVDLYLGKVFPLQAAGVNFMKIIKLCLDKRGIIVFNRLKIDEWRQFESDLRQNFDKVEIIKTSTNYFFMAGSQA